VFKEQRKVKIKWSSNFAYAIGLIASDGYLEPSGRHVMLKSIDRELITNFRTALGIKNKISKGVRGGEKIRKYFYTRAGDINFYRFLNKIGLTRAKSKAIKAVGVPRAYFADFLRGIFDGDGTFYSFWDRRWPNSFAFQVSFASASYEFISWLQGKLAKFYRVKGFIRKGDGVFNLRYVKGDSEKIFKAMYYADNILFLSRKYNKMRDAFSFNASLRCRGSSVVERCPKFFGAFRREANRKTG